MYSPFCPCRGRGRGRRATTTGWVIVGARLKGLLPEGIHVLEEGVDLALEGSDLFRHAFVVDRILEAAGAAVGRVEAGKVEVATPPAGLFAITADLSSFTFGTLYFAGTKHQSV